MSDAYDKVKESTPLNVLIEVLEDLLATERLEVQRLKKELSRVKKLNIDDVSNCYQCNSKDTEVVLMCTDCGAAAEINE